MVDQYNSILFDININKISKYDTSYMVDDYKIVISDSFHKKLINDMSQQTVDYAMQKFSLDNLDKESALHLLFPNLISMSDISKDPFSYTVSINFDTGNFDYTLDKVGTTDSISFMNIVGWNSQDESNYLPASEIDIDKKEYYSENGTFIFELQTWFKDFINTNYKISSGGTNLPNDGKIFHKINRIFLVQPQPLVIGIM